MSHGLDVCARREEADLVARAVQRDEAAIRAILQTHNRKLYRVARSIVHHDQEAEDVLQEAYLKAFSSLASFRHDAGLGTWLTRIVMNEALQRLRRRHELPAEPVPGKAGPVADIIPFPLAGSPTIDPERALAQNEITKLLERAIDQLPQEFRLVLVARTIEGLSIEETSELLGVRPETVKTRLFRARQMLREALDDHIEPLFSDLFPFDGARCGRLTDAVLQKLSQR